MGITWALCRFHMGITWISHGYHMDITWDNCTNPILNTLVLVVGIGNSHGYHMGFVQISHGHHIDITLGKNNVSMFNVLSYLYSYSLTDETIRNGTK